MIRAVIFDMDGVISDTQGLHAAVEEEMLRERGVPLGAAEITARYAGVPDREFFPALLPGLGPDEVATIITEKWRRMMIRARHEVCSIPGAPGLIARLREAGLPLAVASSSPRAFIAYVLERLDLAASFVALASADEVPRGKPEPDVFLLAARRLGVDPGACAVIEDAVSGMIAARRAGMACVGLVARTDREWPADLVVTDLSTLGPDRIRGLRPTPPG